jgi:transcriptional regulator with XRE-family HTH domain
MRGLREIRKERGLTLTKAAGLADVAYPTLACAETRSLRLFPHQAHAVAKVLKVDPMDVKELKVAIEHVEGPGADVG